MIVVASTNGQVGIEESMRILKAGGSALDAVEGGIRLVEDNPEDHSVGYSGYPNILGEVELDACHHEWPNAGNRGRRRYARLPLRHLRSPQGHGATSPRLPGRPRR